MAFILPKHGSTAFHITASPISVIGQPLAAENLNACWKFICSTLIATFTAKTSRCDSCGISDRNESSTAWRRWRNKSTSMCGGHANCARQMMHCLGLQLACLRDGSDSSGSHNQQDRCQALGQTAIRLAA